MKRQSIFKILVMLLTVTSLWSCGGSGEGSGVSNQDSNVTSTIAGASSGAKTFEGFTNEVEKGNFANFDNHVSRLSRFICGRNYDGYLIGYSKLQESQSSGDFWDAIDSMFSFNSFETFNTEEECIDYYASQSGIRLVKENNDVERIGSFPIDAELGNSVLKIKSKLVNRMKNADRVYKCVQTNFGAYDCRDTEWIKANKDNVWSDASFINDQKTKRFVFEYNDYQYVVDLNYPLAMNPVSVIDTSSGVMYSL